MVKPKRPTHLSQYASACLQALADEGLGVFVSLGGALALLHYVDYRPTRDVDAWWEPAATRAQRDRVVTVVETVLAQYGEVHRRAWGEVVSVDLREGEQTVFNFQIAERSALLEPTVTSPWVKVRLDSLTDIVASKMVALVERGAPRDFRDVEAVCAAGLVSPGDCWAFWRRRQEMAGSDVDPHRARLAVETHLERIARHRPLGEIEDPAQRSEAGRVRTWFKTEFLDALSD